MICGGCNMKVVITSAYISEIDNETTFDQNLPFPVKKKFGEVLIKFNTKAWVNDVAFSPSGNFAFAGSHNSTLSIVNCRENNVETLNLSHSPIAKIVPLNDETIIVIGFDRHFYKYSSNNPEKKWKFMNSLTKFDLNKLTSDLEEKKEEATSFKDRLGVFKNLNKKTSLIVTSNKNETKNIHLANISSTSVISNNLVTADLAGYIKLWPL
jgi:hypothetical protein